MQEKEDEIKGVCLREKVKRDSLQKVWSLFMVLVLGTTVCWFASCAETFFKQKVKFREQTNQKVQKYFSCISPCSHCGNF